MAATAILDFVKMSLGTTFRMVRHRSFVLIKYGENRLRFKSYSTFPVSKMAVAAIFDFLKISYGATFSDDTSPQLFSHEI